MKYAFLNSVSDWATAIVIRKDSFQKYKLVCDLCLDSSDPEEDFDDPSGKLDAEIDRIVNDFESVAQFTIKTMIRLGCPGPVPFHKNSEVMIEKRFPVLPPFPPAQWTFDTNLEPPNKDGFLQGWNRDRLLCIIQYSLDIRFFFNFSIPSQIALVSYPNRNNERQITKPVTGRFESISHEKSGR